ncbi:hypothetical protein EMIT051CA3_11341 [Pseudomonas chlororaphis]
MRKIFGLPPHPPPYIIIIFIPQLNFPTCF